MSDIAERDANFVPALQGVSSLDGTTLIDIWVDPTTHGILIDGTSLYSALDLRYLKLAGDNDPITSGITIQSTTATEEVLILKTTDDDTTKKLLDIVSSADASLVSVSASGNVELTDGNIDTTGIGTFGSVAIPTVFTAQTEPTGFVDKVATLSFNNDNNTFTITGNHDIYINGVKTTKTTASIQITDATGLYWIYYDADGNLAKTTGDPDFSLPTIATVYWNTTTNKSLIGEERHGIKMDVDTHTLLHYTVGTRYESGLTGTFDDTTFTITAGVINDEDLAISIAEQTTCNVLYKDGSADFKWLETQTKYYYEDGGSDINYNNGNVLTPLGANQYVAYWIFATNDATTPIVSLMGQRTDGNIANARANNTYESLELGTLPFEEMKLLYRVILRNDATPYEETLDLRSVSNLPAGTYIASDHGTLTGLTDDDHSQYLLADGTRAVGGSLISDTDSTDDLGSSSKYWANAFIDNLYLNATEGSVIFAGTSGILSQDNANLFWEDTNNILCVGTNDPASLGISGMLFTTKKWNTASSGTQIANYLLSQIATSTPNYTTQLTGLNSYVEVYSGITVDSDTGDSGTKGLVRGGWYTAYNSSSHFINDVYGITGESGIQLGASGNIEYAYGVHALISNKGSGTIAKAFPVFSEIYSTGTGTISDAVNFFANLTYTSGTVTNLTALQNEDYSASVSNQYAVRLYGRSKFGDVEVPTALIHLAAGIADEGFAPLKFTSGVLNTIAEAGAMEFLDDSLYFTITSEATRKTIAFASLDNLASVAINTSLISDTDSTDNLGSSTIYWANVYADRVYFNSTAYFDGATAGVITTTAKVGIGTTNPQWKLQVNADTTDFDNTWTGQSGYGGIAILETDAALQIVSTDEGTYGSKIDFVQMDVSEASDFENAWTVGRETTGSEDGDFFFIYGASTQFTGNTRIMTLKTDGTVGIGTATTTEMLTVKDNINLGGYATAEERYLILKTAANYTTEVKFRESSINYGATLRYEGNADKFHIVMHNNSEAGLEALTVVRNGGAVGIGTTSPDYKLQVDGDIVSEEDSTDDLGTSSIYWANAYIDKIYLNSTASLDGATAGRIDITGMLLALDKIAFTQTDGNEYIDSLNDGYMDYGATTQHRFIGPSVRVQGDLYIGNDTTTDPILIMTGQDHDGTLTWMETEDYFEFNDLVKATFYSTSLSQGAIQSMSNDGAIAVANSYLRVVGNLGAVTLSADPAIANGITGQVIVIEGTNDANTVTINDSVNTQLAGGAAVVLGLNDTITLIFNGTDWCEISRSNN